MFWVLTKTPPRKSLTNAKPTQNDPHKLRRLRRPTGPHRAAMRALMTANNYAKSLKDLERFEEARKLLRKTIPVTRRVLGEGNTLTLRMRWIYAETLYKADRATLADLREAVATLEDAERIARRVLGGAHPLTMQIEGELRNARAALRARETPSPLTA